MLKSLHSTVTDGFWKTYQQRNRAVTVWAVYRQFEATGRFDALNRRTGEGIAPPHHFWDSDIAKWMEGACYLLAEKEDPELRRLVNEIARAYIKYQAPDGYFNSYYQAVEPPEKRFTDRAMHELYCVGHWVEAAVAYDRIAEDHRFLEAICRTVAYVKKRFVTDHDAGFFTPGHEELELALLRLYDYTENRDYLDLALHFLNKRGLQEEGNLLRHVYREYDQSHLPVRQQTEAVGHAVRAVYLYCAMADAAQRTGDNELKAACEALFRDITQRKTLITGGIGSNPKGEAFAAAYDLPNLTAYAETCAGIGMMLFSQRMIGFGADARYADAIERILYNNFLGSTSKEGDAFYYENPLETQPSLSQRIDYGASHPAIRLPVMERQKVFSCSCCPPNIVRFLPQINDMICSDDGETVYVHQYVASETVVLRNGAEIVLTQTTNYPADGNVTFTVAGGSLKIALRRPYWDKNRTGNGYEPYVLQPGQPLTVSFDMTPRLVEAHPAALFDCGRVAVCRGPVVYCAEEADNGKYLRDLRITADGWKEAQNDEQGVPDLTGTAYRRPCNEETPLYSVWNSDNMVKTNVKLIPYFAMANRGPMERVLWLLTKKN